MIYVACVERRWAKSGQVLWRLIAMTYGRYLLHAQSWRYGVMSIVYGPAHYVACYRTFMSNPREPIDDAMF